MIDKYINKVHHGDFLNNELPDKSVQLIIADPPYFEVKGHFDFIWKSFDDYLKDVEKWAIECKRILADNGSLFWYGDRKRIAYSQVILDKYFNLENNIYWQKSEKCQMEMFDTLRSFYCRGYERILFYSNEIGMSGLEKIMNTPELWVSLKNYFVDEFEKSGLTIKKANELMGYATTGSSVAGGLFLKKKKEFVFPTEKAWVSLQKSGYFKRKYSDILNEYNNLKRIYEERMRPFNNYQKLSDHFKFTNDLNEHDHDTKKPEDLSETLILTTTRKCDLVFIPFAGSGTECAMSAKTGRRFIAYDVEKKYVDMANNRTSHYLKQSLLF